ncbi:endocuticle structural glycoprotein SgAbd-1-like [Neodiprion virginianus]|uniref:Endocuticle structural glycoprotein SgAbd-1 n=1 Tax=Neodiprion lecontei TaxID=441921 RepID=A0ABM3FWF4_NEOLC|nr:endocuticle structural glycoprotein SgAbd-1 [Neodiprion lecontei]XP_046611130.1 endocuticle structural glycoprotein SgAbd-1-like [Neodiprion virginianus]
MNTRAVLVFFAFVASVFAAPAAEPAAAPVPEPAAVPAPVVSAAQRSSPAVDPKEPIAIISQESEVNPDGTFVNKYETANGISVSEESSLKTLEEGEVVQVVKGSISYPSPDGTIIETIYTADENGFHPSGDHLPVAPETPAYILKSLEWSAAHPEEDVEEVEKKL